MLLASRLTRFGIEFPFMAGPMVGISHVAFRELVRSYLPRSVQPLLFTEMLSTRRLPSDSLEDCEELRVAQGERNFVPQLLGNEERFIKPSIERLLTKSPWGFDINMGCPVKHTLRHNWGVRLLGDRKYAAEVVRMTKAHSSLPVSVKLRGGIDELDLNYLLDFTAALEDAGADWLTLHARPKSARHTGKANWEIVSAVRAKRTIPVVANGDIQTCEDALAVLRDFGADGAMFGRAIVARPWVLGQLARKLGFADDEVWVPETPEDEGKEYYRAVAKLCDLLSAHAQDEAYRLQKLRFFVVTGSRWFLFGHAFWKSTMKAKSITEIKDIAFARYEQPTAPMYQHIDHF
jgi:tRNA-dihydrouridine synthase